MPFSPGATLGNFTLLEPLGAGGMGEVYRAKDNRLNREVAIKVLPEYFIKDEERLTRFEREAKLLASLNHPNLAAIYEVGQEGDTCYLVLELVPGENLAQQIARGPLPVKEALEVCLQVAAGMEAAHEKGVIHRDLKPANIRVTPDGTVKVLDFGLAKSSPTPTTNKESSAETDSFEMTRTGMVLGTAAYMSPEQARGKQVDKRTDIWAFGCVLFEALTGKKAFEGDSFTDVAAAILEREPNWNALPPKTPTGIRRLLWRSVQKNPTRRLNSFGDARIEIEEALGISSAVQPVYVSQAPGTRRNKVMQFAGIAALSLVMGALIRHLGIDETVGIFQAPPQPVSRVAVPVPPKPSLRTVAISPDGQTLIYSVDHKEYLADNKELPPLYARKVDDFEAKPIPGTEGGMWPEISPDGKWILFQAHLEAGSNDKVLRKVNFEGGPAVTLMTKVSDSLLTPRWLDKTTLVYVEDFGREILTLPVDGGEPTLLTDFQLQANQHGIRDVQPVGDGKHLMVTLFETEKQEITMWVELYNLESKKRSIMLKPAAHPRYLPTGHIAFTRKDTLFVVPYDLATMKIRGGVLPIHSGLPIPLRGFSSQFYYVADQGNLAFLTGEERSSNRKIVTVDRTGKEKDLSVHTRDFDGQVSAPIKGKWVGATIYDDAGIPGLWAVNIQNGQFQPVSTTSKPTFSVLWSPDGESMTYLELQSSAKTSILSKKVGSTDEPVLLGEVEDDEQFLPHSWTPDGKILLGSRREKVGAPWDIFALDTAEKKLIPYLASEAREGYPQLSPDGKWLAYISNEGGTHQAFLREFHGADQKPGPQRPLSINGASQVFWSPTGKEIFFIDPKGPLFVIDFVTEPEIILSQPKLLFDTSKLNAEGEIGMMPDGENFLFVKKAEDEARTTHINLILNWHEELKALDRAE